MELKSFAELVKRMRATQTAYFKSRSRDILLTSKKLEALVDRHIEIILQEDNHVRQNFAL